MQVSRSSRGKAKGANKGAKKGKGKGKGKGGRGGRGGEGGEGGEGGRSPSSDNFDSYGANGSDGDGYADGDGGGLGNGQADGDGKGGGGGDGSGTGGNENAALDSLLKSPRCPREYCVGCRALVFCCECEATLERHSPLRRSPSPPRSSPSPRGRPPIQIEGASPIPPFRALAAAARLAERQVPLWKQRHAAGLPVGAPRRHWQVAPMAPEFAVLRPSRSLPPMGLSNGCGAPLSAPMWLECHRMDDCC